MSLYDVLMATHAETLLMNATEYAAEVDAIRAPLLAEIASYDAEIARIKLELADCFDTEERAGGFDALEAASQCREYVLHILPSNTPMWG